MRAEGILIKHEISTGRVVNVDLSLALSCSAA